MQTDKQQTGVSVYCDCPDFGYYVIAGIANCTRCNRPKSPDYLPNESLYEPVPATVQLGDEERKGERIHELKTWSEYFNEVFMGRKTFEVRKNDRDFKVGDILTLEEGDLGGFPDKTWIPTGRKLSRRVTGILYGGQFGIEEGYCVMSIQ